MTKGKVLRYAIAFALRRSRKIVRGLEEGLTEDERYAVADHAVAQLKGRGDPWRLNEEAPAAKPPSRRDRHSSWTEGIPPTPRNPPSVLKPRSPRPGLIFVGQDSFGNRPAPERGNCWRLHWSHDRATSQVRSGPRPSMGTDTVAGASTSPKEFDFYSASAVISAGIRTSTRRVTGTK